MKNFLIYRSSAGSGKTYTLVKEYLKLILTSPGEFRRTLAITFTNKAADEMKSRVVSSLASLAAGTDIKLALSLRDEGIEDDIAPLAKEALSEILHKYSYFAVSTIDSFFHKIIRAFARELKLQLGYDVELDENEVLNLAVDKMFDKIQTDENLREYLENYIYYNIDEDGDWKVEQKVRTLSSEVFKERYWQKKDENSSDVADSREKMLEFVGEMFKITNTFDSAMMQYHKTAIAIFDKFGITIDDFPHKGSGYMSYLIKKIPEKEYEPNSRTRDAYGDPTKLIAKNNKNINLQKALDEGLSDAFTEAIVYYNRNHKKYFSAKELTKTVYVLGIFSDLIEELKEYRDENKLLLISDTNKILRRITANESSPFIYEKIGNTYKNYLIDEFQDTSTYQWQNLLPLVVNSISEGNFSMIVGDVKQSIYRWRSGNMKLLLEQVTGDLHAFREMTEIKPLAENWRSCIEIINFNNTFFETAARIIAERNPEHPELVLDAYSDTHQTDGAGKKAGYVSASFTSRNRDSELSAKEKADARAIEHVKQAVDDGYPLEGILILTRKKVEAVRISGLLQEAGYKVVSNESLLIKSSSKVKLIISLLNYIADITNKFARTEALYYYEAYLAGKALPLDQVFQDYRREAKSLFDTEMPGELFSPGLHSMPLYELIENLIRIYGLNSNADSYVLRLLEAVLEFSAKNNSDIHGFLSWWEEKQDSISIIVPERENAIRVMTVHKAKGLQAPVVIIPYANWDFDIAGNRDTIWVSSEIDPFNRSSAFLVKAVKNLRNSYFEQDYNEEYVMTNLDNLNLLYVAFTRAAERLYIIAPMKRISSYNAGTLIKAVLSPETRVDADMQMEFGKREKKRSKSQKTKLASLDLKEFISAENIDNSIFQPRFNDFKFRKSNDKINKGIILHKALSLIKTKEDNPGAVSQILSEGFISHDETDYYIKELNSIINFKDAAAWYDGSYKVYTEHEMLVPNSNGIRPDRVMVKNDEAVIVDYKTGVKNPDHIAQLKKYSETLSKAGYKKIEAYIYYISEMEVVKV